jgi:hypothetical protein
MSRFLLIGLLLLGGCEAGVTSIRAADGGRKKIDCSASYISVSFLGSYTCEQFDKYQATNGDPYNGRIGGIFQTFDIYGESIDGVRLSLAVSKALSNGFFTAAGSAEEQIRSYNTDTKQAQNWGYLRRPSLNASAIDFTMGPRKCFGFQQYGGIGREGFGHITKGYFCAIRSSPYSDNEMASLIDAVVVRDSVSASSQPSPAVTPPVVPATAPVDGSAAAAVSRTVLSATHQRIGFWYSINPDCTSRG